MKTIVLTALICVFGLSRANGFDLRSSREIGQGGTISLTDQSATEALRVSTGWMRSGQWLIETGYDREFELSDLDRFFVAGAMRLSRFSFALGLSQFGSADLYAEQTVKLSVSGHWRSFTAGAGVSGRRLQFGGGYDNLQARGFSASLAYRRQRFLAGLEADNLAATRFYDRGLDNETRLNGYLEVLGHRSFSLLARTTFEAGQRPQIGLAQRLSLGGQSTFFWGFSTQPARFGAGIELRIGSTSVSYAGNYHPSLGFSFVVSASVLGGVSPEEDKDEFD